MLACSSSQKEGLCYRSQTNRLLAHIPILVSPLFFHLLVVLLDSARHFFGYPASEVRHTNTEGLRTETGTDTVAWERKHNGPKTN